MGLTPEQEAARRDQARLAKEAADAAKRVKEVEQAIINARPK